MDKTQRSIELLLRA